MSYDAIDKEALLSPETLSPTPPERVRLSDTPPITQGFSREVLRAWRSKYPPHVGEKQKRRALARQARAEKV